MDHASEGGIAAARLFLARTTLAAAEVHAALYCAEQLGDADSIAEMRAALEDTTRLVAMANRAVADAERAAREAESAKRAEVEGKVLECLSSGPRQRREIVTSIGVRRAEVDAAVQALVQSKRVVHTSDGLALSA